MKNRPTLVYITGPPHIGKRGYINELNNLLQAAIEQGKVNLVLDPIDETSDRDYLYKSSKGQPPGISKSNAFSFITLGRRMVDFEQAMNIGMEYSFFESSLFDSLIYLNDDVLQKLQIDMISYLLDKWQYPTGIQIQVIILQASSKTLREVISTQTLDTKDYVKIGELSKNELLCQRFYEDLPKILNTMGIPYQLINIEVDTPISGEEIVDWANNLN